MTDLEHVLLDVIIANGQDMSKLDAIVNELGSISERKISTVIDEASEQRYTKACLLRFMGLTCKHFGAKLVRFRLLPALNSQIFHEMSSIFEVFMDSACIRNKLESIEDVLRLDVVLKKSKNYQPRQRTYGGCANKLYMIDRTWIPAFIVCVTKVVIAMQDTAITWAAVVETVTEIVVESFSNLVGGWMEAGLCLAAVVLMEEQNTLVTGLTANTVIALIKDNFAFACLQKASNMDKYTCLMVFLQKLTSFPTADDLQNQFEAKCYDLILHFVITTLSATELLKELEGNLTAQTETSVTTANSISCQPHISSISYCVIQHAIVTLALNRKDKFFPIALAIEKSPAISDHDRCRVWYHWFQYLAAFGGLFLESSDKQSQKYDQRRHDLTTTTQWMTTTSLDFFANQYITLVEKVDANPFANDDEKHYIRHASQQTVLRLFLNLGNTGGGIASAIRRFLECFPSAFLAMPWDNNDNSLTSAAIIFLAEMQIAPPRSLVNTDGLVDVTIFENRAMIKAQEEQLLEEQQLLDLRQQQLMSLQYEKEQLEFEHARDFAREQRRTWLSEGLQQSDEVRRVESRLVDIQDSVRGVASLFVSEQHMEKFATVGSDEFENDMVVFDADKGDESTFNESGVESEDEALGNEEPVDGDESDNVVEILDSSEEGENVVEGGKSDDDHDDEYSDDFNDDDMEDASPDDAAEDISSNAVEVEVVGVEENYDDNSEEHVDMSDDVDEYSESDQGVMIYDDEVVNKGVHNTVENFEWRDTDEAKGADPDNTGHETGDEGNEKTCDSTEEVMDSEENVIEGIHDEKTSTLDRLRKDLGDTGSQVDNGYEPDTAAHTEGEVSEEFQTEEEDNDDEEGGFAAGGDRIIPGALATKSSSAYFVANSYSDNNMDAADEQTASDVGAESSEMEEGNSIHPGKYQTSAPSSTLPLSTLIEYAHSAQRCGEGDRIGEELATDLCHNHYMQEGENEVAIQRTLAGVFDPHSSPDTTNDILGSTNIAFDFRGAVNRNAKAMSNDDICFEDEVAAEADIDTEPEYCESQPESESVAERDISLREVIDQNNSDATEEFPPKFHDTAIDTNKSDYDADSSEAPRIDDDEVIGDEVSIEYSMDPPPSRPAKVTKERSVSFKQETELVHQQMHHRQLQDKLEVAVGTVTSLASSSDPMMNGLTQYDGPLLPRDIREMRLGGNPADAVVDSDTDLQQTTESIGVVESTFADSKDGSIIVIDKLPRNEESHPVLSVDNSTMVQTGDPSDDGSFSLGNEGVLDKIPAFEPVRQTFTPDLSMTVHTENTTEDQNLAVDYIAGREEIDALMVKHVKSEEERSQSLRVFRAHGDIQIHETAGTELKQGLQELITFEEPSFSHSKNDNIDVIEMLPDEELCQSVFSRDPSTIVPTGNLSDDGRFSVQKVVAVDKLPVEIPDRPVLVRDLSMMIYSGNTSNQQSLSMDDIAVRGVNESVEGCNVSMVKDIDFGEKGSHVPHDFAVHDKVEVAIGSNLVHEQSCELDTKSGAETGIYQANEGSCNLSKPWRDALEDLPSTGVKTNRSTFESDESDIAENDAATYNDFVAHPIESTVDKALTLSSISGQTAGLDLLDLSTSVSGAILPEKRDLEDKLTTRTTKSARNETLHDSDRATSLKGDEKAANWNKGIDKVDCAIINDGCASEEPLSSSAEVCISHDTFTGGALTVDLNEVANISFIQVRDGMAVVESVATLTSFDAVAKAQKQVDDMVVVSGIDSEDVVGSTLAEHGDVHLDMHRTEESNANTNSIFDVFPKANKAILEIVSGSEEQTRGTCPDIKHTIDNSQVQRNQNDTIISAHHDEIILEPDKQGEAKQERDMVAPRTPKSPEVASVSVEDVEFRSPMHRFLTTAEDAVVGVKKLLSPLSLKKVQTREQTTYDAEIPIRKSHRRHRTPTRSDSFVWCDPIRHHDEVAHDRHEKSPPLAEEIKSPTKTTRSRKREQDEVNTLVSSQKLTKRAAVPSTRTRKTAASKGTVAKVTRRTSLRSIASASSHADNDYLGNEVHTDIEGRLVDCGPESSPALSSIAPSSMASSGGLRRTRRTAGITPNSKALPGTLLNDLQQELVLPRVDEECEEDKKEVELSRVLMSVDLLLTNNIDKTVGDRSTRKTTRGRASKARHIIKSVDSPLESENIEVKPLLATKPTRKRSAKVSKTEIGQTIDTESQEQTDQPKEEARSTRSRRKVKGGPEKEPDEPPSKRLRGRIEEKGISPAQHEKEIVDNIKTRGRGRPRKQVEGKMTKSVGELPSIEENPGEQQVERDDPPQLKKQVRSRRLEEVTTTKAPITRKSTGKRKVVDDDELSSVASRRSTRSRR